MTCWHMINVSVSLSILSRPTLSLLWHCPCLPLLYQIFADFFFFPLMKKRSIVSHLNLELQCKGRQKNHKSHSWYVISSTAHKRNKTICLQSSAAKVKYLNTHNGCQARIISGLYHASMRNNLFKYSC